MTAPDSSPPTFERQPHELVDYLLQQWQGGAWVAVTSTTDPEQAPALLEHAALRGQPARLVRRTVTYELHIDGGQPPADQRPPISARQADRLVAVLTHRMREARAAAESHGLAGSATSAAPAPAALRGKAVAYQEAADLVRSAQRGGQLRRRWWHR